MRRKVAIVSTGGTIASRYDPAARALVSVASGAELLAMLGSRAPDVDTVVEEFCNLGSNRIDLAMSLRLAQRVDALLADESVGGCVVTHGTDTLEESAFLASLVIASPKPVVFTGAQRDADEPDADGPRNLVDAIRIAASPDADGLGTVLVFGGRILSPVDATKVHTSRTDAYAATAGGQLGEIDDDEVLITHRPARHPRIVAHGIETRVDLIKLTMGCDTRLFDASVASGARGIVLETFGRGNATPDLVAAVAHASGLGIVTVATSRCREGRVRPLYGDGGGRDLEAAGALFAGRLQGPKARVLLSVALANPPDDGIAAILARFGT
jgi:L-asparaginase